MSESGATSNPYKREWQARVECDTEGHVFDNGHCLRCGVFSYAAGAGAGAYAPKDIYRLFGFDVESTYGRSVFTFDEPFEYFEGTTVTIPTQGELP